MTGKSLVEAMWEERGTRFDARPDAAMDYKSVKTQEKITRLERGALRAMRVLALWQRSN